MSKKETTTTKAPLKNWRNYEPKQGYEDYTGCISMTVPDQSYTVQEIIERFKAGIRLPIDREVYYSNTDDFDHPDGDEFLDITDYHERAEQVRNALIKEQGERSRKAAGAAAVELAEQQSAQAEFQAANTP